MVLHSKDVMITTPTPTPFCPVHHHDKPPSQLLGKGGHGAVYGLDPNTVLKCIPTDEDFVQRILQEARFLRNMHTVAPQLFVQLHESWYDKKSQCVKLTMERCEMDVHTLMTTKPSALIDGLKDNIPYYGSNNVLKCFTR